MTVASEHRRILACSRIHSLVGASTTKWTRSVFGLVNP
jgi:hypothetical protein